LAAAPVPETAVPESAVATLAAAPTPPVDLAALSSTLGSGPASEQASDLSLPTPAEAIPMHAEWLAARGGGSVRLQLHPPELGAVELTVRVRGSNVQVVISAIEPAAQALVQASAQQLGEQLASRDLRMDHFEVRALPRDAGAETFNEQARGRFERQDSESRPRFSSNRQPGSNISLGQPVMLNPHSASSQHLAATGVDLRV
jgi:flagellar hook-length control protein FliK